MCIGQFIAKAASGGAMCKATEPPAARKISKAKENFVATICIHHRNPSPRIFLAENLRRGASSIFAEDLIAPLSIVEIVIERSE